MLDELAVAQLAPDGGLANSPRTIGVGRHPLAVSDSSFAVAYLEPDASPLTLSLATFNPKGVATGVVTPFTVQSNVVDGSNPVLAGLTCGQYVAAWADFGGDGDELGVAIRIVQPGLAPSGPPAFANTTTTGSQFDPDLVVTESGQIVVSWVDDSNPSTAPDLRFRTFDASLDPTSGEQTLAATADSEADVALAAFGSSWAAAWRDDASGLETVRVQTGSTDWTIGPAFLPAPMTAKPALVQLDANHLLVAYAVGTDPTDSGVASGSEVQLAVLDTASPGSVTGTPLVGTLSSQSQSQPALAAVQGQLFVAWWTAAALGDANGEENWLKPLGWKGTALDGGSALDTSQPEVPLPRWAAARTSDQRGPALAASTLLPGGSLVTAWDDLGRGVLAGEGAGDVVAEIIPVPVLRTGAQSCPKGWTDCHGNPEYGCETDVSQPSNCGACGNVCAQRAVCLPSGGSYACVSCPSGTPLYCGGTCVDPTSNPDDCNGCGIACSTTVPNAQPACVRSACSFACDTGFTECNGSACVNTTSDVNNCSACGHVCAPPANATSQCVSSSCKFTCNAGYGDCDGAHCTNLASDPNNCSTCGHACSAPANATPICSSGACGIVCNAGFTACPSTNPTSCIPQPVTGAAFVSPGATGNCSESSPCGTIAAALAKSSTVYLDVGTYTEQVSLGAGQVIHGGWSSNGGNWTNCGGTSATSIIAAPAGKDRTIIASGGSLDTLTVRNANTATAGQTLYGIFASSGALSLTNVAVSVASGGNGGQGSAGSTGSNGSTAGCAPPASGASGTTGFAGSAGTSSYGAAGFSTSSGTSGASGGPGADGTAAPAAGQTGGPVCLTSGDICTYDSDLLACTGDGSGGSQVCGNTGFPGCPGTGGGGGGPGTGAGASIGLFAYGSTVAIQGGQWSAGKAETEVPAAPGVLVEAASPVLPGRAFQSRRVAAPGRSLA